MVKNIHPVIYEKTRDGERMYDVFSRLVKERIIFLAEPVDAEVGTTVAATLFLLDKQSTDKPISIYINSPGGTVCDGLFTIYDTIQYIKAPVHTVCIGTAYSAAAVVLAAGKKRIAFENSEIMIHEVQSGTIGSCSKVEKETKRIKAVNERIINTLAKHTGQSIERIKEDCKNEIYLTAQEAKEYGLIDAVVKSTKK